MGKSLTISLNYGDLGRYPSEFREAVLAAAPGDTIHQDLGGGRVQVYRVVSVDGPGQFQVRQVAGERLPGHPPVPIGKGGATDEGHDSV